MTPALLAGCRHRLREGCGADSCSTTPSTAWRAGDGPRFPQSTNPLYDYQLHTACRGSRGQVTNTAALSTCPPAGRVTLPLKATEVAEDSGRGPVPSTRPLFSDLICETWLPLQPCNPEMGRGVCQPWSLSGGWSWAQAFRPSSCWGCNKSDGQPCLPACAPPTGLTGLGCLPQYQTGSALSNTGTRGRVPTEGISPTSSWNLTFTEHLLCA